MAPKEYRKLHAEWYEIMSGEKDHSKEIEFLALRIAEAGQPVLELGSGTGRILVPLLERGIDIYGIDTSKDMMDRCRAICKAKGLKPKLYEQSMLDFDLNESFGTVLLPSGSLGLFVSDQDVHRTFERVMAHLKPGGLFIYEFEPVPIENKSTNDSTWTGDWRNGPDGVVIAWRNRNKYDSVTHTWKRLFVIEKFARGRLIETEANERVGRYFTVEEAVQFGRLAGFREIRSTNWLTDDAPRKDSKVITVQCRKPSQKAD